MAVPLKDQLDAAVVDDLAARVAAVRPDFDHSAFAAAVGATLDALELKDRVNLIADELAAALGPDYAEALAVVVAVADIDGPDGTPIEGFGAWPLCSFVERHGLRHPEQSLAAMPRLTRRWSCEFAIRPYLDAHLDTTLEYLRRWVTDPDEAVRRLVSEGTRPRLPWGPRVDVLLDDPGIGVDLITPLRHDPDEVVRQSVANHLNDVARADPDRVVALLADWAAETPPVDPAMIRHALRTLVKQGHSGAMAVLGFTTDPEITVTSFSVSPRDVSLGTSIELAAELRSTADAAQRVVVDFVIHHVAANGSTSPKVFKWTTVALDPGQTTTITKRRRIQTASTRRYHRGAHRVELQVAGRVAAAAAFDLLEGSV